MIKKEKFLIAEYRNIELKQPDAAKLRGYFADMDGSDTFMHNHMESGESIYRYPRVQYKVIHHHPVIVAFGEGINSLYPKLMDVDNIVLGETVYQDPGLQIKLETKVIGDSRKTYHYKFLTPWLALNQENYKRYLELSSEPEKRQILEKILTGNILSMCRGFAVELEQKITALVDVKDIPVKFKGESMIGFIGHFEVNVHLPTLCGIGKGVSRGMGTIGPVSLEEERGSN